MPKRGRPRGTAADVVPAKQNRDEQQRIIVCGLYDQGRKAVAKCLLQELKSAMVLACDLKAGRRAVPKKAGAFEVRAYTEETPQLPSQDLLHAVVLSHVLARPSRVAAAMASASCTVQLLTVLDARSFLDDWESPEELPLALREAAKTDARAHLRSTKKACEVLAEHVESADVIALSHADAAAAADADELEMLEAMLRELNPSAAIVRRAGDGEGGGKMLEHVVRASPGRPAPNERSGCWQAVLAARKQDTGEGGAAEEEEQGEEEEDGDESDGESDCESDCESDEHVEHDEGDDEGDDDEGEGEGEGEQDDDGEEAEEVNEDWVAPVMSRFAFLSRRPFHPARLHKLLKRGQLDGVIRSSGLIWVATHPQDGIVWNQVRSAAPGPWLIERSVDCATPLIPLHRCMPPCRWATQWICCPESHGLTPRSCP